MGAAGSDTALETSDVALMAPDLLALPGFFDLGRRTLGNIRFNVVFSIVTKVIVLALAISPALPNGYIERLSTIVDIDADPTGSAQGRWTDYQVATEVVIANPILGVGLGEDILALNAARGRATWRSVHNAFLEYAVDLGIPGLLLFVSLLFVSFGTARRVEQHSRRVRSLWDVGVFAAAAQIALVGFAVAAFFHPIAYQFYFFCVAGLAVAVRNVSRNEAQTAAAR